jgi:CDP-6-deoxy-D-xylo-4-hexulose-3-dehydrase
MVRESSDIGLKNDYIAENPLLNPDFIFAYPAYNVRNTEIGGILGSCQLKRLDENILKRTNNFYRFLDKIDSNKFRNDFFTEGSSNYAFNLILREPDLIFTNKLIKKMNDSGIEFRRGSAGGGNQLRQPYLKDIYPVNHYLEYPQAEHIHFYGFYLGNYPSLSLYEIDDICSIINSV